MMKLVIFTHYLNHFYQAFDENPLQAAHHLWLFRFHNSLPCFLSIVPCPHFVPQTISLGGHLQPVVGKVAFLFRIAAI